jgi:PEP-CTERM motif-containing protein
VPGHLFRRDHQGRAAPAMADNIQLSCPSCTTGGVSLISSGTTITFSFIDVASKTFTGNAFIAILVPTGDPAPTLTGGTFEESVSFTSGTLGAALGDTLSYQFSALQSASAQVIPSPSGYTVYEFDLGKQTLGPSGADVSGLVAIAALGSVIVGFLECKKCGHDGTFQTPLSESITSESIAIPEPSSLGLLALGLVGLLGLSLSKVWPPARLFGAFRQPGLGQELVRSFALPSSGDGRAFFRHSPGRHGSRLKIECR